MTFFRNALTAAAMMLCHAGLHAQSDLPEANPGRPTVSTPATLTAIGYLQFENGGLYARTSQEFTSRTSINQVTKLTVAPRLQLLALSEPLVQATGADITGGRPGEVFLGLQTIVLPGKDRRPTVSLSYIRRLYESPAPELDTGTFRQSALVFVSHDLGKFHFDVNGIFAEQAEKTVRRGQFGQTLSISHPLGRFTIAAELWHFTQPLSRGTQSAIFGRSLTPSGRISSSMPASITASPHLPQSGRASLASHTSCLTGSGGRRSDRNPLLDCHAQ